MKRSPYKPLPKTVELMATEDRNFGRKWFVTPTDDRDPTFSSDRKDEPGIKQCLAWLQNRGYVERDTGPGPQSIWDLDED